MLKKILLAVAIVIPFAVTAQELKFGYVNSQEIMMKMPEISNYEKQMADFNAKNNKYLQDMDAEIQTKYAKYEKEKNTLSESVRKAQEEELVDMQRRLQTTYQTMQADSEKKQQELLKPIQEKLLDAIQKVGKKNNFFFIFEVNAGILYKSEKAVNVDTLVKKELGIN